jgi:hypothetical protein
MPVSSSRRSVVGSGRLEIRGQANLQHVLRLIWRTKGLRIRAGEAQQPRLEARPHRRVRVARFEDFGPECRDAPEVGQRWHVHDRQTGLTRSRDTPHQLSNARGAVLRLLHRKDDQIEAFDIGVIGRARGQRAGQFLRRHVDRGRATPYREPHDGAFAIDQIRSRFGADERDPMSRHQQLRPKQRPVGGA